jgi:hypothetical protein
MKFKMAKFFYKVQNYSLAKEILDSILNKNPNNDEALNLFGLILMK